MLLSDIGYGALLLTLAAAAWAAVASFLGAQRRRPELVASARNALLVTAALSSVSAALLLVLLFTHDFEVRYVYEHVATYLLEQGDKLTITHEGQPVELTAGKPVSMQITGDERRD